MTMTRIPHASSSLLILFSFLALLLLSNNATAFQVSMPSPHPRGMLTARTPPCVGGVPRIARQHASSPCTTTMALQDEDDGEASSDETSNAVGREGQAGSFGEYLIPYALAGGGSLLATALFVKFVLLDN